MIIPDITHEQNPSDCFVVHKRQTHHRTEHSLTLLLEIMHWARNLPISQLLCELIPNLSVRCAVFQITCRLLVNKKTDNKHNG